MHYSIAHAARGYSRSVRLGRMIRDGRVPVTYNLWREYPTAPYLRWACAVAEDETTPAGYRISDYDPTIADPGFVHALAEHMGSPVGALTRVPLDKGGHIDQRVTLLPGDHRYVGEAVRQFPNTLLGGSR